ncbi:MAG: hypothetical protein ACOCWO_01985 [Candidatus Muiribacteriaceae bacterium]
MYNLIHFLMVFIGTICGFMLATYYSTSPFLIELFPENTMVMTSLLFGSSGYLAGVLFAFSLNLAIKKLVQKINMGTIIPQIMGVGLGLILVNLLLIPVYVFMFNLENGVFVRYMKLLIPLIFNIIFAFTGGRFGEKYFEEHNDTNRKIYIDTSIVIDGRLERLVTLELLKKRCVVPDFVIDELRELSDSHDEIKRKKGRSGLELVEKLKDKNLIYTESTSIEYSPGRTDDDLIRICRTRNGILLTTDYNLAKKGNIEDISTLFLKDIENALRPNISMGDMFSIELIRKGKEDGQSVGYLEDGTMVVAQNGEDYIGDMVKVSVENIVNTKAGKIIFVNVTDKEAVRRE